MLSEELDFTRKPDGGLADQIEVLEAFADGGADNTELLMLLIELRSLREQQPVTFEWRQHYSSIGKSGPWVKLNDQRTYEKLKSKHAGDADYEFRELFTAAKPLVA